MKLKDMLNAGGFSLNVNNEQPKTGFMVSVPDFEVRLPVAILSPAVFGAVFAELAEHVGDDKFVGGWVHNGTLFMDVSENVPTLDSALTKAVENDQLAIWDVANATEIPVKDLPIVE